MSNSIILALHITFIFLRISAIPIFFQDDDPVHVVCKPSEDGLPVFIPHPYECNKYFECQDYIAIAMTCPDGLVFHPDKEDGEDMVGLLLSEFSFLLRRF